MLVGKWYRFDLDEQLDSGIPAGLDWPGNYIALDGSTVLYVGESSKVSRRLRSHVRPSRYATTWRTTWGTFRRLTIAVRRERVAFERLMIEARMIARLNPRDNVAPGRPHFTAEIGLSRG